MELIINNISMVGFSKIYNSFDKQISGYYVNNKNDTVDVSLGDSSLWHIDTFSWGVCISNAKSKVNVTLVGTEFEKIVIQ